MIAKLLGPLVAGLIVTSVSPAFAASRDRDDDKDRDRPAATPAAPKLAPPLAPAPVRMHRMMKFDFAAESMGATPGGAKDISSARDHIMAGEVPHPNTFTPEGLFSEYDLPLPQTRPCKQVLCLSGAAAPVDLIAQPEARVLAQIGFASNLDARTWRRDPMNIVAVVDKSGSMSGEPIETVKASLHQVVDQLGAGDQLAVVLYGDRAHVHLNTSTLKDKRAIHAAIDQIAIAGSTDMESGLKVGYQLAEQSAQQFRGRTRVMLFTDERPNVGATGKDSFMGMARAASKKGIGLTTVGVGTQFGAELATAVSSVRGGNLVFFPSVPDMKAKFQKDLDTLLSELAFDLKLKILPQRGYQLAGLYGLPGDAVKRTPDGGLELTVETIFLSKDRGGIYFALSPAGAGALPPLPGAVAHAQVSYQGLDGRTYQDTVDFQPVSGALPQGLAMGRVLVDEMTTLKKATELHLQKNDQEGAYQLVRGLSRRLRLSQVQGLEKELQMVTKLEETLTRLSGHKGEPQRDTVSGLPQPR